MKTRQGVTLIFLFSLVVFPQVIFGQSNTTQQLSNIETLNGWESLISKSTENEVKEKYASELTILEKVGKYGEHNQYYCPFEIQNYSLGDYDDFTVSFLFDENSKKLFQVIITKENPKNVLWIFQNLKENLTEKYGTPSKIEEIPNYYIKWSFEELDIEMKHNLVKGFDKVFLNSITISYQKSEQDTNTENKKVELENKVNIEQLEIPRFQLFPTENHWTFIKLDTRNGKMWQVHFTISEDGYQGEKDLNARSLILTNEEINGRFTLIPTKNMFNFILLDQISGKTYQVQWHNDYGNRFVIPI